MNTYKKILTCCVSVIPFCGVAGVINKTFFEQTMGGHINESIPYKDVSKKISSTDGTLMILYRPIKQAEISFDNYSLYITPLSKKIAIIEANKIEDSIETCKSTMRYFTKAVVLKEFASFKTAKQLESSGFKANSDDFDKNESKNKINQLFDIGSKINLQYGCIPSNYNHGKFAFIVSFNDSLLRNTAQFEKDKIIATKNINK